MFKKATIIFSIYLLVACAAKPAADGADRAIAPVKLTQTSQGVQITTDDSVLFDVGNANISEKGFQFIDKVAEMLRTRSKANVIIEGHTDNTGSPQLNIALSEKRSTVVRDALISRNVESARLSSKGYGQTKPVAENTTVIGETVENVGGDGFLNSLTNALTNFLKSTGTVLEKVAGKIESVGNRVTRSLGGEKQNPPPKKSAPKPTVKK